MSSWLALGLAVDRISISLFSRLRPRRPKNGSLIPLRARELPLLRSVEIDCGAQRDSYEIRGGSFPDLGAKRSDEYRF